METEIGSKIIKEFRVWRDKHRQDAHSRALSTKGFYSNHVVVFVLESSPKWATTVVVVVFEKKMMNLDIGKCHDIEGGVNMS